MDAARYTFEGIAANQADEMSSGRVSDVAVAHCVCAWAAREIYDANQVASVERSTTVELVEKHGVVAVNRVGFDLHDCTPFFAGRECSSFSPRTTARK